MLCSVILLPTFHKNVMIPTSEQGFFKVNLAGSLEILLNNLTKLRGATQHFREFAGNNMNTYFKS